jgi:hypothetical protein
MSSVVPTRKEVIEILNTLPSTSFTNEHGEKFVIATNGLSVYMAGDEVNMMVDDENKAGGWIPLFNPKFNMWSKGELRQLGKALQELCKDA